MKLDRFQREERLGEIPKEKEDLIDSINDYGKFKNQREIKECLEEDLKELENEEKQLIDKNNRFDKNLEDILG
jgi:hypothetical protein